MQEEQQENSKVPKQLQPHVFKKGQSGNPNGRPPGKTLKEYGREMLAAMTDEERQEFLQGIDKLKLWEMVEGRAESKTDVTSNGNTIVVMPPEVINRIDDNGTPPETEGSNQ